MEKSDVLIILNEWNSRSVYSGIDKNILLDVVDPDLGLVPSNVIPITKYESKMENFHTIKEDEEIMKKILNIAKKCEEK